MLSGPKCRISTEIQIYGETFNQDSTTDKLDNPVKNRGIVVVSRVLENSIALYRDDLEMLHKRSTDAVDLKEDLMRVV